MEELTQQIAHLIGKFGFAAVAEEVSNQMPLHPDGGGGNTDSDSDKDDGIGALTDGPNDI